MRLSHDQAGLQRRTPARGYTLIEVLVIVVILGIAGSLVIPSMSQASTLRVQAAVRTVISDITFAQADAMAFQERRAVIFDTDDSSYRIVSIPAGEIDPDSNTLYDPTKPGGLYVVQIAGEAFGDAQITAADFDGDNTLIFDDLGGPVAEPSGDTPSELGSLTITGSGSNYVVEVEPFTGRVTVQRTDP